MPSVAVILPTYNERPNIEEILRAARAYLPDAHVLVVDDDSPDGTAELAEKVGEDLGGVTVLNQGGRAGFAAAYRTGFAWALAGGYDVIVQMDADGSHDPSVLPRLVGEVTGLGAADCAVGSRYAPGGSIPRWTWRRRALSRAGNRYAASVLRLPLRDATSGYRASRAGLLDRLDVAGMRTEGYAFQIELVHRAAAAGARFVEVPIAFIDRTRGESKMSGRIVFEALRLVTVWAVRDRWRRTGERHAAA